jgi:hypothetical protein
MSVWGIKTGNKMAVFFKGRHLVAHIYQIVIRQMSAMSAKIWVGGPGGNH